MCDFQVGIAAPLAITRAGAYFLLNGLFQGSTFYQRIGNKICMKSIYVTGYFSPNLVVSPTKSTFARIMVIYDAQANGLLPTGAGVTAVILSYTNTGPQTTTAVDQLNPDNKDRFKILCDWRTPLLADAAGTNALSVNTPQNVYFQRYCKLQNLETLYNASTGTVGDIRTGSLLLVAMIDGNNSQTDADWTFTWTARLRYCDV